MEFALVLPVLMVILFGIIEFGFILYDKAVVTNASREAARRGIVYRKDAGVVTQVPDDEVRLVAVNYCASYLVSLGTGTAAVMPPPAVSGNCAVPGGSRTVTVSYPYTFLFLPKFADLLPSVITLNGTTVMRCEYQ